MAKQGRRANAHEPPLSRQPRCLLAGAEGIEPPFAEPKPAVLPLNDTPKGARTLADVKRSRNPFVAQSEAFLT